MYLQFLTQAIVQSTICLSVHGQISYNSVFYSSSYMKVVHYSDLWL